MAETRYDSSHTGQQIDDAVDEILNKSFIVNDLTTGGIKKALSAEQGKVLAQRVTEIEESGVGGGMLVERTEDDYHVKFNFIDNSPALAVSTQSIVMGGNTKTATFKVSGQRLKGNINISVIGTNFSLNKTSLSPTDGVVAETTITLTYSGTATATATITISSTGATSKTISAQYQEQQVPTIDISTDTITFKAGVGGTQTKTLLVKGYNLEGAIALAFTNNVGGRFTLSQNSFNPSGGSVNAQVSITYTPQSGDTGTFSATLRATSTNATNVDVPLSGIVSTIDVSKNSIELTTEANTPVTDTFTIEGANLNGDVTIGVSGTGFSVSPSSITKNDAEASGGASVVVTYLPTSVGTNSGQITIQSSGITKYVTLGGTATEAITSDAEGKFTILVNGQTLYLKRKIVDGQKTTDVEVHQSNYDTAWNGTLKQNYSGDVVIPASVVVDGVRCNITTIASNAFRYDGYKTRLTSLTLPEGLTTIGGYFLYNAQAITSLVIPSSVISIGSKFCGNANHLVSIDMRCAHNENFVNSFGAQYNPQLKGCSALTSFVFPDNITENRSDNFDGCSAMQSITLGKKMQVFYSLFSSGFCPNVTEIICRGTTTIPHINLSSSTTYSIPQSVFVNATLHVPVGYKERYKKEQDGRTGVTLWSGFTNIVDDVIVD